MTHDASFQSVDERRNKVTFRDGGAELNFVDSFAYNIAAYRLEGRVVCQRPVGQGELPRLRDARAGLPRPQSRRLSAKTR